MLPSVGILLQFTAMYKWGKLRLLFERSLKHEKSLQKLTSNCICFILVEIYEKIAGQCLAEVKFAVIIPEVCNPEKIVQRKNYVNHAKYSKYKAIQKQ